MISRDFPLLPGKEPKYNRSNSCELPLNFGDIIYRLSRNAMHYLDDREALGWSWLPPEDLINRVMKGGTIKFDTETLERFTLQIKTIGFLLNSKSSEEHKSEAKGSFEIVDAQDSFYKENPFESAVPAKLGQAPVCFIERMQQIVAAAKQYQKDLKAANSITFLPHPDYAHVEIAKAPEPELDYAAKFMKLYWQNKAKGIKLVEPKEKLNIMSLNGNINTIDLKLLFREDAEPYDMARNIRFISVADDMAFADLKTVMSKELAYTYFSNAWKYPAGAKYIRDTLDDIFGQLGIQFNKSNDPLFLMVSKDNLLRLQKMGAELIHLNTNLTLEDKVAVAFGCKPKEIIVKSDSIEATFHDDDSIWGLSDWMQSSGVELQNVWRSFTGTRASFKTEQKGIGDRFLSLIDKKVSEHSLVLNVRELIKSEMHEVPSLAHGTVRTLFAGPVEEKKEEPRCAMRLG